MNNLIFSQMELPFFTYVSSWNASPRYSFSLSLKCEATISSNSEVKSLGWKKNNEQLINM